MAEELSGKVAIVTGAAQGTGRAYARALAQEGATVIATSRSMKLPAPGEEYSPNTLAELGEVAREAGEDIHLIACDVGVEEQITRCVEQVIANFGRIDIVVNNAATYPEDQPVAHYDPIGFTVEEWERYNRINVIGPYLMIREVAPHMIRQKSGNIVNITSGASLGVEVAAAQYGMLGYVTTKAALNRLSQFYALEFKDHNIAVNALCPGTVVTNSWRGVPKEMQEEMLATGNGKLPTPEAVGLPLLFLVKQTAETYSGQVVLTNEFGVSWP
jgi:NAD(P)-dependent dehydrogenase (short-subunit alcohol dehydrogenase family)